MSSDRNKITSLTGNRRKPTKKIAYIQENSEHGYESLKLWRNPDKNIQLSSSFMKKQGGKNINIQ